MLMSLLPLLLLFVLPALNALFSGSSGPSGPQVRFDTPASPYTKSHTSNTLGVKYYVNPSEVSDFSSRQWTSLDRVAEQRYMHYLNGLCEAETQTRAMLVQEASGWFRQDTEKMERARKMPMTRCAELNKLTRKTQQAGGFGW
jgi:DnaJ family protein B protein 12